MKAPEEFDALYRDYSRCSVLPDPLTWDKVQRHSFYQFARKRISSALAKGDTELGESYLDFIWEFSYQLNSQEAIAHAHWCSGIFDSTRDPRRSLHHAEAALESFRKLGLVEEEAQILIGYAHQLSRLGRFSIAEVAIKRSIQLLASSDYPDLPICYINLSSIQGNLGRYLDMLDSATQAESLIHARRLSIPPSDPSLKRLLYFLIQAQINQANARGFLGEYDSAIALLRHALQQAMNDEIWQLVGYAEVNLAHLLIDCGKLFEALQLTQAARKHFQKINDVKEQAYVDIEEARLYQRLGMHLAASSISRRVENLTDMPIECVEAGLIAVATALELGQRKAAHRILEQIAPLIANSISVSQLLWKAYQQYLALQSENEDPLTVSMTLDDLRHKLSEQHALDESLTVLYLQLLSAYELEGWNFPKQCETYIEIASTHELYQHAIRGLRLLATKQSTRDALLSLRRAADITSSLRRLMPIEELKANLVINHQKVFVELIEKQLELENFSAATTTLIETKGSLWHEIANTDNTTSVDTEWVQSRSLVTYWRAQRFASDDPEFQNMVQKRLGEAESRLIELSRTQVRQHTTQSLPSIEEIVQTIDDKTVVLDYLIGSEYIWCCIIQAKESPKWKRLCKSVKIAEVLKRLILLRNSLQSAQSVLIYKERAKKQIDAFNACLSDLYRYLIRPLSSQLKNCTQLFIAPDRELYDVPWSALFSGQEYLSQRYIISLLPSSSLAAVTGGENSDLWASQTLLLGCAGRISTPLHYIDDELERISNVIPNATIHNPATVQALAWSLPPAILHISAHGHMQPQNPLLSHIELADDDLLLAEAFKLNLKGTQLVTLSACHSAEAPEQGNVVLALAGAFLCAGATTVLASLWAVDDEAAALLMGEFYNRLKSKLTIAEALRQAQDSLRSKGYEHPFYWAAFQPLSRTR